ncbi:hemolysin III family protein [Flagellimonas allohymeniacidonis]|uniref:Hemolysin III family protein n=1 Tax=Flagellimonas allohymeniacidonis TaxID=2517819 RepID=A0A4Q8QGU0_9FLAO|nr:hemolysin III family protein [Allomuricauda hymeniacidonis]
MEERWNAYSHGFGILLSLIGLLFWLNHFQGRSLEFKSGIIIYSASLILLFTASTVYHAVDDARTKRKLRVLDHISIYYLIAGTYTPVCLLALQESKGSLLLIIVWGMALFGTLLKLFFTGKFEVFSLLLYAFMGWSIVIDFNFLKEVLSSSGLFYLGLGGAFYTVGILFYAIRKIPYNHLIWHFFVLGGAISHWIMIYKEMF